MELEQELALPHEYEANGIRVTPSSQWRPERHSVSSRNADAWY
jgi:hypothetical protein